MLGPVPLFLQWGYQLSGSIETEECKRCCTDGKNVTDKRVTTLLTGQFWATGGIGVSFHKPAKEKSWFFYGYLGIKLEGSFNFVLAGTVKTDRCHGKDTIGEICGLFNGTGRIAGGGMVSAMFGWFQVEAGAEVFGTMTCEGKLCYNIETNETKRSASCSDPEAYAKVCAGICFTKRIF
jgi:hypothetical protein